MEIKDYEKYHLKRKIRENKETVDKKNLEMLTIASIIAVLLMVLLSLASLFVATIERSRGLYASMAVVFVVILVLSLTLCKKKEGTILPCCYLFLIVTFGLAVALGTFMTRDGTAVSFCVLLFTLPQLFIDRYWRMQAFQTAVALLFCVLSFVLKDRAHAALDCVNVGSFLLISYILNYFMLKAKVSDIHNQKLIRQQSERDSLTEIFKREAAEAAMEKFMSLKGSCGGLVVIDIDNFKTINDTYGHQRGDEAIRCVARGIAGALRKDDIIGRFGGDEFIAFLKSVDAEDAAQSKGEEICDRVQIISEADPLAPPMSISVGIAMYPKDGTDYKTLFVHGDAALYQAKKMGKNQVVLYSQVIAKDKTKGE